jgi:tryptophan-rich sensory protein
MRKKTKRILTETFKLIGIIILCLLAGIIGSLFTQTGPDSWYAQLEKPTFNPPNWIFGPVWTTLYILIGISFYLALKNNIDNNAKKVFAIQLILNTLWTVVFFGLQRILLAVIVIILLWTAILVTIIKFYKKSHAAAYLLIPYILWVSFATLLTIAIHILNSN